MARAKDKVIVGYCHPVDVNVWWSESLLNLHIWDAAHDQRVIGRIARYSSANVSNARNGIVRHFLSQDEADYLLMLDTDMTFQPSLVDDLLVNASRDKAPIVGGLCFGVDEGRLFPTLYGVAETEELGVHMVRYDTYPPNAMFRVAATGAACTLIHRTVFEKVGKAEEERGNTAYPWYQEATFGGHPSGEDVTFCLRAGAQGFPVYVDTGVSLGHVKSYILDVDLYAEQRANKTPPAPWPVPPGAGGTPEAEVAS